MRRACATHDAAPVDTKVSFRTGSGSGKVGDGTLFRMDDDASRPRSPLLAVVDDDESVRESLPELLRSFEFEVYAFCCAEDFLASDALAAVECLILDVAMPSLTGLELQ